MARWVGLVALVSMGCGAEVRNQVRLEEPTRGAGIVQVDVDRGYLDVVGGARDRVEVDLISWAKAGTRAAARSNEARNSWSLVSDGTIVSHVTTAPAGEAGVDSFMAVPFFADLWANVGSGDVFLEAFNGTHSVGAWNVRGRAVEGEGTFVADNIVELELYPYVDAVVDIEAYTGVDLWLPFGGEYDIEVFHPTWARVYWDDLGFVVVDTRPGYTRLVSGRGLARFRVDVIAGDFHLYEAY